MKVYCVNYRNTHIEKKILGIPEHRGSSINESPSSDRVEVSKVISAVVEDCPMPSGIFRVGKYDHTKNCKIKLFFDSPHAAKSLLRGKKKLPGGIKIVRPYPRTANESEKTKA